MNGREHVVELLGAYALDALDEAEAALVRAHLAECSTCRAQWVGLAEAAGYLPGLYPSEPPAPELRGRVLAAIQAASSQPAARLQQPARAAAPFQSATTSARPAPARPLVGLRGRWAQAFAALVFAAAQVWLIATVISLRAQVVLQGEAQTILLSSNEAPVNLLPPDPASVARGVFHYEPDLRRGLISYYRLPPPGSGRAYQCWMEFEGEPTQSCGRMTIDGTGAGLILFSWPNSLPSRIRATLETGSPALPAGPTVLLGAVQPSP
jgi:hypothetical protein